MFNSKLLMLAAAPFTSHLHDILVHLLSAGLSWMASACELARAQPVARVIHWLLPCKSVRSASDLSRRSHCLPLKTQRSPVWIVGLP